MHKQDIAVKYRPDLNYNKNQIMSPTEVRKHGAQRTVFRASKAFTFPLVNPDTRTAEAGLEDICKFSSERCSSV